MRKWHIFAVASRSPGSNATFRAARPYRLLHNLKVERLVRCGMQHKIDMWAHIDLSDVIHRLWCPPEAVPRWSKLAHFGSWQAGSWSHDIEYFLHRFNGFPANLSVSGFPILDLTFSV